MGGIGGAIGVVVGRRRRLWGVDRPVLAVGIREDRPREDLVRLLFHPWGFNP